MSFKCFLSGRKVLLFFQITGSCVEQSEYQGVIEHSLINLSSPGICLCFENLLWEVDHLQLFLMI